MRVLRVSFEENNQQRTLLVVDPSGAGDVLPFAYAAAGEVHLPIGPGAHDCKFEEVADGTLFLREVVQDALRAELLKSLQKDLKLE